MDPKHTNRLVDETSPYLLQHAHNPVDWYPWGEEAIEKARAEQRPIILSVGYSSCHWCHVMERESFEDEATAALMNEHFISIKVDREERPDIDEIYMQATLALGRGRGGWPMNVFLTPDLEPFFAGTYFPPQDRFGMPAWSTVVSSLASAWSDRRGEVVEQAQTLTGLLREGASEDDSSAVDPGLMAEAVDQLAGEFDFRHGGFGPAPKFPHSGAISLILRHHQRTGSDSALVMAAKTLEGMARGGIYDHVGGGFARYSTDERWLVPHFEKMLYDNALLTRVYLEGFQATGHELFRRVAADTLEYVLREMTSEEGGFYSATDADSEGVEGKFFVWDPEQLVEVLDAEEARRFGAWFDVSEGGNWEGSSILNTPRSLEDVAKDLGISVDDLVTSVEEARPKVYEARKKRVPPGLDDKILTSWNALMISAFADGYRVLGDERYLDAATKAANFVLEKLVREDGGLLRSYRTGRARFDAYLEDYAFFADACIDLYEAGGHRRYLAASTLMAERLLQDFASEEGGPFFSTATGHEQLILRYREGHDGALPSANAVAARALVRLSYHLDLPDMREAARVAVEAYGKKIARAPRAFCTSLAVLDLLREGPVEVAVVGSHKAPATKALWEAVNALHLPNRLIAQGDGQPPADGQPELPLLSGKTLVDGQPALYVCRGYACQEPVTDPAGVAAAIQG